ncbi:Hypothetical predicted protein [Cloeon dipterum]|uniref:RanBD1 domain-containing protein n=1 Tax=Cloeon dipterum TaxID=197152 RepID=A0A8S1D1J2_9INSE|nr:Hypothetical predicted protein [Cloeon dipterum]
MADHESDKSNSLDGTSCAEGENASSDAEESTKIVISHASSSDKEDDHKDEESDSRGMYTAATRGFPPSRLAPRAVFGSSQAFGGNPFAAKPSLNRPSMEEGSSSWPGLTPSKLGGSFGSAIPAPVASKFVLKPSAFGSAASNAESSSPVVAAVTPKSSNPLIPSRLGNPFANKASQELSKEEQEEPKKEEPIEEAEKAKSPSSVKFVPLGTPSSSSANSSEGSANVISTPNSFVFGQNLRDRVVAGEECSQEAPAHENGTSSNEATESIATTNGTSTSEMLFSAVIKKDTQSDSNSESEGTPAKSLSEAAREYEESRAVKRKFDEVEVKTGEEEETNVLQISCKLHIFDNVKSSWAERGRGQLRLNDKVEQQQLQSRVIMRTHGSLRVVLNTKVWPEMVVDRANVKSVRFTAMDEDQIKVFLVTGAPKDADNLYLALERRVTSQRIKAASAPSIDNDVPSPDAANSDIEKSRACMDATSLPDEQPSLKKDDISGCWTWRRRSSVSLSEITK